MWSRSGTRPLTIKKYRSPVCYEVFISIGRSLPPKDRKGDAMQFDERSVKRENENF